MDDHDAAWEEEGRLALREPEPSWIDGPTPEAPETYDFRPHLEDPE